MMRDRASIIVIYCHQIESYLAFRLAYLRLNLVPYKVRGQDHAHFDFEYLVNDDRQGKYNNCHHTECHVWAFNWHINI